MNQQPLILFDGICNLCNNIVQFVIKRDKGGKIHFAALQSEIGQAVLKKYNLPLDDIQSIVFIDKDAAFTQSTAALKISKYLSGLWPLFYGFIIVPKFIRDIVYKWIAKNRYKWFGQKDSCMVPTPEIQKRFLN